MWIESDKFSVTESKHVQIVPNRVKFSAIYPNVVQDQLTHMHSETDVVVISQWHIEDWDICLGMRISYQRVFGFKRSVWTVVTATPPQMSSAVFKDRCDSAPIAYLVLHYKQSLIKGRQQLAVDVSLEVVTVKV